MPTYEYVCAECDHSFEEFQLITKHILVLGDNLTSRLIAMQLAQLNYNSNLWTFSQKSNLLEDDILTQLPSLKLAKVSEIISLQGQIGHFSIRMRQFDGKEKHLQIGVIIIPKDEDIEKRILSNLSRNNIKFTPGIFFYKPEMNQNKHIKKQVLFYHL